MRAATVTMPMFCTSTMRMPVRMTGSARMSSMPVRICQLVMPMPRAASTAARGTRFSPATVLAAIGSSEYRNRATAAGAAPMPRIPSAAASGTAAASAASGTIRMPNSAIAGIVWITLSVPSTPERSRGTRWHRMPIGSATSTAAASDPRASHTCWRASRANRSALTAYSRITERWSNVPCARASPATAMDRARNSTRRPGPGRMRVTASVAIRPRHMSSTQKPAPGATRTTLLPAGVSASPAAATASAAAAPSAPCAHSLEKALRLQVVLGDRTFRFAVDLHARIELLQRLATETVHQRLHDRGDLRVRLEDRLANDRHRRVHRLVVPVVLEGLEVRGEDATVGPVHHGRVRAVGARGRSPDGRRGLPAGEHDQLVGAQPEPVGLLQRAQGAGVGELGRADEHHLAAARYPSAEVAHGPEVVRQGHVAAHGQRPGVAGPRGCEPDDVVGGVIESGAELIALLQVLPGGVGRHVEKEPRIAGVFDVQIDLAGEQRLANDRRRTDLGAIERLDPMRVQQQADHLSDHR